MRFDENHIPYVLEVNAFPSLIPGGSSFAYMAEAGGLTFEALIQRILGIAMKRNQAVMAYVTPISSSQSWVKRETQPEPPSPAH